MRFIWRKRLRLSRLLFSYLIPRSFPAGRFPPIQIVYVRCRPSRHSIVAILLRRSATMDSGRWFWFIIALVPMIGLLQVGIQARADRYTYVSLIGIFIAIVWSWPAGESQSDDRRELLRSLRLRAHQMYQTRFWHDTFTSFSTTTTSPKIIFFVTVAGESLSRCARRSIAPTNSRWLLASVPITSPLMSASPIRCELKHSGKRGKGI